MVIGVENRIRACFMISYGQLSGYLEIYLLQYLCVGIGLFFFFYTEFMMVPRTDKVKFQWDNPNISKSYVENELVNGTDCLLLSVFVSSFVVVWHCVFGKVSGRKISSTAHAGVDGGDNDIGGGRPKGISKEVHLLHISLLCLSLILTINGALTNALKLSIGNLRPDFLARCQPIIQAASEPNKYYTLEACKQANKAILYEGLKSTPSGHSSFISSSMGFLFFWQCYFVAGNNARHLWCPLLAFIVMVSRITDHRHHWYDLIFGAFVGLSTVFFCWKWIFTKSAKSLLPSPVGY